jgi:hypothetical protein
VCRSASAIPGRALPAAHPHTEFTTSINTPGVFIHEIGGIETHVHLCFTVAKAIRGTKDTSN